MRLFAFRGKQPNFGDELNHWLWDRLLPDFFDEDERVIFLGIGSVLYDTFDPEARKIVFGAGYGGYRAAPRIDENWQVYFVRGRETAKVLGLDPSYAIGDAGILVRSCWDADATPKRYRASFMPHYESAMYGNWARVCERAGIHFIDPRLPVEEVLGEISASEVLVSEAMHGVVVADALRVPWRAVRPLDPANRAKWHDWASPLGVTIDFTELSPSNVAEKLGWWLRGNSGLRNQVIFRHRRIDQLTGNFVFEDAIRRLKHASSLPGQLSDDAALQAAHAAMVAKLAELKADHAAAGERPDAMAGRSVQAALEAGQA